PAALRRANELGRQLMEGIQRIARERKVPMLVSGFGTAFAVHFTQRTGLRDYRDTLDDDAGALQKFLRGVLAEGIPCLPDGRFYTSSVHGIEDVEATLAAVDRVLGAW